MNSEQLSIIKNKRSALFGFYHLISFLIISLIAAGCSLFEDENGPEIKVHDFSSTEVWLDIKPNGKISVLRDGVKIATVKRDTIFYDSGLQPNTTYEYKAADETASVTTLDTTSNNFTWETYTFGDYSSVLRDVAIVDEDNIWSVGEIYFNDSTGQPDPTIYNIIQRNANEWKSMSASVIYNDRIIISPLYSVFIISINEIWLCSGIPMKGIGNSWTQFHLFDMGVLSQDDGYLTKMWGSSDNILYVGTLGTIAQYQNSIWKRIETGTETNLLDVFGEGDNVFTGGWNDFHKAVLFHYKDGNLRTVINEFPSSYDSNKISGPVRSLWVKRKHLFTLTDYSLYRSPLDTQGEGQALWTDELSGWAINRVRGTDVNNIFTVGYNGSVWHYNGKRWKQYEELLSPNNILRSVSVNENMVVIVGERNLDGFHRYGLVIVGRR